VDVSCPKPGVYEDVEFDDYLSWDALSSSRLKLAATSLAHYKAGWQGEETPALRFGSLVHCGQLEPMALAKRYAVMPAFEKDEANVTSKGERTESKVSKYYKDKKKEFFKVNADKVVVPQEDFDQMLGCVKSICGNAEASRVLNGPGPVEVSVVWQDEATGLMCKGRYDKLNSADGYFADLKTACDVARFRSAIINYGYHRQAAFYREGWRVLTGELLTPWLVPIEKSAPYGCCAAPVSPELIQQGWQLVSQDVQKVATALEKDEFPGYENPQEWVAPDWYQADRVPGDWYIPDPNLKPAEVTVGGKTILI
jgi:exodeoxyribonuclease VIII